MRNSAKRSLYLFLRRHYQRIPAPLRVLPVFRFISKSITSNLPHADQVIYTTGYYESHVDPAAKVSFPTISESLADQFNINSVIDFGSGTGVLIQCFERLGIQALGLEQSDAAREMSDKRGVRAIPFDLRFDQLTDPTIKVDLATCFEVAEHIEEKYSNHLVALLTDAADIVAFTAAPPGQGGYDHVNEKPLDWWREKFREKDFIENHDISNKLREKWASSGVQDWYYQNLMIFRRNP